MNPFKAIVERLLGQSIRRGIPTGRIPVPGFDIGPPVQHPDWYLELRRAHDSRPRYPRTVTAATR
jgi:hypothetical protein